jgi:hypothetical protein
LDDDLLKRKSVIEFQGLVMMLKVARVLPFENPLALGPSRWKHEDHQLAPDWVRVVTAT